MAIKFITVLAPDPTLDDAQTPKMPALFDRPAMRRRPRVWTRERALSNLLIARAGAHRP